MLVIHKFLVYIIYCLNIDYFHKLNMQMLAVGIDQLIFLNLTFIDGELMPGIC